MNPKLTPYAAMTLAALDIVLREMMVNHPEVTADIAQATMRRAMEQLHAGRETNIEMHRASLSGPNAVRGDLLKIAVAIDGVTDSLRRIEGA